MDKGFWSGSEVSRKLHDEVVIAASHDLNVLILGETGSGKEVIADLIQASSGRKDKPYVKLNCAAIPETLIESELFGHEKGSFTGAEQRKKGKLEAAHEGILLLDEIGDMPVQLQSRLLRVTDGYSFSRVGSNEEITVDVRFISATHIDIHKAIEQNRFRSDLFYRLASTIIRVPPLRERKEEILTLAERILKEKSAEIETTATLFSSDAMAALLNYNWPGNFRELENKVIAGMLAAKDKQITAVGMFNERRHHDKKARVEDLEDLDLNKLERGAVEEALRRANFVQKDAAALLKISSRALNHRIRLWGLRNPAWPVNN